MLHNFYKDTTPRHVRDFYLARVYRAASTAEMNHYPQHYARADEVGIESMHDPSSRYMALPRTRPRGDDGRFVPRADEELPVDNKDRKVCGWCGTTSTSQWRVGPTHGSVEMGTLCNACGINYRRALTKFPDGALNLDRLAQQMGHTRLSIQKALKRQRKLSAPPHQFKRSRTVSGASSRSAERYMPRAVERYPTHVNARNGTGRSNSSLTMLLSDDSMQSDRTSAGRYNAVRGGHEHAHGHGHVHGHVHGSHGRVEASTQLGLYPMAPASRNRFVDHNYGAGTSSQSPIMGACHDRTSERLRRDEQSPLPPFQSFIGDLERRTLM